MTNKSKIPDFSFIKKEPDAKSDQETPKDDNNLLQQYSLNGKSSELLKQMQNEYFVMGNIVLGGQSTIIFAQPGVGKTLIAIKLLIEATQSSIVDGSKVFYINADDTYKGLVEKLQIVEEHGINMLAPNHNNFLASDLSKLLIEMCEKNRAHGIIIIIDTIKKVTDPMQKGQARDFWNLVRAFVSKGGTLVALAHANKHLDSNGKPVYAGTSDSVDDVDCAYTLRALETNSNNRIKLVQFENIKNRGNVALTATYQYSTAEGLSYRELLDSVEAVDDEAAELLQDGDLQQQADVVAAIEDSINHEINQKMDLIDAVAKSTGASKRSVQKLIEQYTGNNSPQHKWNFQRERHGAQIFFTLEDDDY